MNFLTNTKRDGFWDNNLDAPFTKATNKVEVPGPGKYDHEKKQDDIKTKILMEDGMAFLTRISFVTLISLLLQRSCACTL